MFPPSLYSYIVNTMKKHAILVLNKVDLVSPEVILAWKSYFAETYPNIAIVIFASNPKQKQKSATRNRSHHKRSIEGVHNIYQECKKIVQSEVDLTEWEQKILEDMKGDFNLDDDHNSDIGQSAQAATHIEKTDFNFENHEMFKNGILTIGCVGFPNVGKSSFINALKGRKVVSVSRTPGHTKHFQTIFLTNNVKLCDCPGLVFPSSTPKYLQVLFGSYPISQLRQPFPSLKYLSERVDIPKLLKLTLPPDYEEWSAVAICEAWAIKRGFLTAKASRPDLNRAANYLLRMCLSGLIVLEFYPPDFIAREDFWKSHPDMAEVIKFKGDGDELISVGASDKGSEGEESNIESSSNDSSDDEDSETDFKRRKNAFSMLDDN